MSRIVGSEILKTYSDKIPIIIKCKSHTYNLIVPKNHTIMDIIVIIRSKTKISYSDNIKIMANTYPILDNESIDIIYKKYRNKDNCLYLEAIVDNTFKKIT